MSGRDCTYHLNIVLLVGVVVLELTSACLYLECRLLDIRTGAPDFAADEYVAGGNLYKSSFAPDYESAAKRSRRQELSWC